MRFSDLKCPLSELTQYFITLQHTFGSKSTIANIPPGTKIRFNSFKMTRVASCGTSRKRKLQNNQIEFTVGKHGFLSVRMEIFQMIKLTLRISGTKRNRDKIKDSDPIHTLQ